MDVFFNEIWPTIAILLGTISFVSGTVIATGSKREDRWARGTFWIVWGIGLTMGVYFARVTNIQLDQLEVFTDYVDAWLVVNN